MTCVTVFVSVAMETQVQGRRLLQWREGTGKHEFTLLRVQMDDTVSD